MVAPWVLLATLAAAATPQAEAQREIEELKKEQRSLTREAEILVEEAVASLKGGEREELAGLIACASSLSRLRRRKPGPSAHRAALPSARGMRYTCSWTAAARASPSGTRTPRSRRRSGRTAC